MRKNKNIAKIMTLAMMVTLFHGMTVNAAQADFSFGEESVSVINNETLSEMKPVTEELEQVDIANLKANVMEREYTGGQFSIDDPDEVTEYSNEANVAALYSTESDTSSNTDPNNAYIVTNDTVIQAAIETAGEMRWYAFVLDEKSKVTIPLQMIEALDADLYMYSLNTETYQLELVGGSATEGVGVSENYNNILEAGTYYFAVGGYEGAGNFALAYYQSSSDVSNEVNDSATSATNVTFNSSISGVIDNPSDFDYYTFTVTKPTVMSYSITTTDNYALGYATPSGTSATAYPIDGNLIQVTPGTYYFAVYNPNGNYSATSTYTVDFTKVSELANDSSANYLGVSEKAGIVFQSNSTGSKYYVNGNPIDINYAYINKLSNSAGSQSYDISLEDRDDVSAYLSSGVYEPGAVYYLKSTRPNLKVESKPVLELTFVSSSVFYKIHCICTGDYAANNLWKDMKAVTVLIDPDTGKLIDISDVNYFYDFAQGSNSMTFTRPYTMKFNYEITN